MTSKSTTVSKIEDSEAQLDCFIKNNSSSSSSSSSGGGATKIKYIKWPEHTVQLEYLRYTGIHTANLIETYVKLIEQLKQKYSPNKTKIVTSHSNRCE